MGQCEKAIITTILYGDIFGFPLTKRELWQYLMSGENISKTTFERTVKRLSKFIICEDGYYARIGRQQIITERKKNAEAVEKKLRIAKSTASILSYIPTILFIGISGGLAASNADKDADIDFFIITKRRTLFTSRLLILSILELIGLRRSRTDDHAANKVCVNLLIDESELIWPSQTRDFYTAREIIQVKPLFQRNNTYIKFLESNNWVKNFYSNAYSLRQIPPRESWHRNSAVLNAIGALCSFPPVELLTRFAQKKYMNRHHTRETVSNTVLAFHPHNYRVQTLRHLKQKMRELGLLTNI